MRLSAQDQVNAATPKHVGWIRRALLAASIAALVQGCSEPAGEVKAPQATISEDTVEFPAGSNQLASIVTAEVKPRGDSLVRLNGRIVWDEERTVRVLPPLAGRVLSVAVRAGDAVRPGQSLALVSAPDLGQSQADARKAEQDRAQAQRSLARLEELHGAGVAPAKDLQAAQADLARADAEQARTAARLAMYGASAGAIDQRFALRTPIAGVVVERNLSVGQELRPDQALERAPFVISDPAHLWFVLDVAEADVGVLKAGAKVVLRSPLLGEESATGTVVHVADAVDPQTRTVKARGTVENRDRRLKAEMFVTAELKVASAPGLVVPANAVYLRGDRNFVFAQTGAGRFTRKAVRLGTAFNGSQVVLDGLGADEKVVVDGALLLQRMLAGRR